MSRLLFVRKKPVQVQAMLFDGTMPAAEAIVAWASGAKSPPKMQLVFNDHSMYLDIETLEGTMRAKPGDYILCGVAQEFYPCDAAIFGKTYDIAPDPVSGPWCLVCNRPPSSGCHGSEDGEWAHDIIGSVPYGTVN